MQVGYIPLGVNRVESKMIAWDAHCVSKHSGDCWTECSVPSDCLAEVHTSFVAVLKKTGRI